MATLEVHNVNGYAAFKLKLVCEECYPNGPPDTGSYKNATWQFTDPNGRLRYRCDTHNRYYHEGGVGELELIYRDEPG